MWRCLRRPLVVAAAADAEEDEAGAKELLSGKEWLVSSSSALRWCRDSVIFDRREWRNG